MGEEGMYDAPISAYSIGAKTYTMTKLKEEHVHDDDDDIEQPPTKVLAEEEVIGEDDEKEKIDDDDDGGGDDDEEEEIKSRPFFNLVCNPKCLSPTLVWILMGVALIAYSLAAFILDFQRSYWLLIVELLIGSLIGFQWVTDHYCPQQKSDFQTTLVYWIDEQGNTKLAALVIGLLSIIIIGIMTTDPQNLISVVGMLVFVLLSWLASYDPWQVNWLASRH